MATKNQNRVPVKQWRKWSEPARRVFNRVYTTMMADQSLFLHPKAPPAKPAHWKTTCWNAAWIAADAANE